MEFEDFMSLSKMIQDCPGFVFTIVFSFFVYLFVKSKNKEIDMHIVEIRNTIEKMQKKIDEQLTMIIDVIKHAKA